MAEDSDFNIFGYEPSLAAAGVFIGVFLIFTVHHGYLMFKEKCWYWWPFFVGVVFEVIGFSARIASAKMPSSIGAYATQTLFILLPPAMFAASIYMAFGRLLVYIKCQKASLVKVRWMTAFFVTGDVLSFLMQGGGGGMQASADGDQNSAKIGSNIVIGGLVVQLVFFGGFVVTSIIADRRLRKWSYNPKTPGTLQWRWLLNAMYLASILILIRSVFRVVEYAEGYDGYLMQHEVFMYCFDSVLMTFVCVIFSIVHPSKVMIWDSPIEIYGNLELSSWDERKSKK